MRPTLQEPTRHLRSGEERTILGAPMPVNLRPQTGAPAADARLYLKEDELDRAVETLFAAARRFARGAEPLLAAHGLGPAHYRALSAIRRDEGLAVAALREALGVRKQSLARVLAELDQAGLIARAAGQRDRRERRLHLTPAGRDIEAEVSAALRERLAAVFRLCGAEAVAGARTVWAALAETDAVPPEASAPDAAA